MKLNGIRKNTKIATTKTNKLTHTHTHTKSGLEETPKIINIYIYIYLIIYIAVYFEIISPLLETVLVNKCLIYEAGTSISSRT